MSFIYKEMEQVGMVSHTRKKATPNDRLRHERKRKYWTQNDMAGELYNLCDEVELKEHGAIDGNMVSKWERGLHTPSPFWQKKLCKLFLKNPEELGFVEVDKAETCFIYQEGQATFSTESTEMKRRQALHLLGAAGVALTTASYELLDPPLWERLSRTLARTSPVDETALNSLEQITRSYWQLRKTLGYRTLLSSFLRHLETVTQLLRYSQPPRIHKRLCAIASEVAQYTGATLFDMNEHSTAYAYYKVSIEAAQEAEHYALWAIGLGRMSFLPIYVSCAQDALPLLRQAQRLAAQHSMSTNRAWLASIEAEAHANLNDTHACLLTLADAESMIELVKADEDPCGVKFDYSRFVGYKGICHLRLQQPQAALRALNEAIELIDSSSLRQRSIILTDTARAYSQLGEVDEACKFAGQALEMTTQIKSGIVMQRIYVFRKNIKPWETVSSVKNFDDQLATYLILDS